MRLLLLLQLVLALLMALLAALHTRDDSLPIAHVPAYGCKELLPRWDGSCASVACSWAAGWMFQLEPPRMWWARPTPLPATRTPTHPSRPTTRLCALPPTRCLAPSWDPRSLPQLASLLLGVSWLQSLARRSHCECVGCLYPCTDAQQCSAWFMQQRPKVAASTGLRLGLPCRSTGHFCSRWSCHLCGSPHAHLWPDLCSDEQPGHPQPASPVPTGEACLGHQPPAMAQLHKYGLMSKLAAATLFVLSWRPPWSTQTPCCRCRRASPGPC